MRRRHGEWAPFPHLLLLLLPPIPCSLLPSAAPPPHPHPSLCPLPLSPSFCHTPSPPSSLSFSLAPSHPQAVADLREVRARSALALEDCESQHRTEYNELSETLWTVKKHLQECSLLKLKAEAAIEEAQNEAAQQQRLNAEQQVQLEHLRRHLQDAAAAKFRLQEDLWESRHVALQEAALRHMDVAAVQAVLTLVQEEATDAVRLAQYHGQTQVAELTAQVSSLLALSFFDNSYTVHRTRCTLHRTHCLLRRCVAVLTQALTLSPHYPLPPPPFVQATLCTNPTRSAHRRKGPACTSATAPGRTMIAANVWLCTHWAYTPSPTCPSPPF